MFGRFYQAIFVPFITLSFITRLSLLIYAYQMHLVHFKVFRILEIFVKGIGADLVTFFYIFVPIYAFLLILPKKLRHSKIGYYLNQLFYLSYIVILCFSVAAEITFWDEFNSRFNFIAVDYLIYTKEVIGNIIESYPLYYIIPIILIISLIFYFFFSSFKKLNHCRLNLKEFYISVILLCTIAFTYKPQLFEFKKNQYYTELSKNGIYSLFYAYRNNHLNYGSFYTTLQETEMLANLRGLLSTNPLASEDLKDITRIVQEKGLPSKKNLVLITVESLSAEFLERYGNTQNLTPFLNQIMKNSINFTKYYATGTRTVRGLEAMTLSVPPTPGTSLVRKPNNEDLFSIGSVLKDNGYENKFLYGGFGYFDNMTYFFHHNNFTTIDRSNMAADQIAFANVWGVSDEDLFKMSLEEADKSFQKQNPFFLFIMTTSNHRPFTYPDSRIDIPSGTGRMGGVKYSDYAIHQFINSAKDKPWFKDTIFVITADHCAGSAGKTQIPINKYHIPLMIYSPTNIKPKEIDSLASQIDLAPTLLSLLNISYKSKFFGTDIINNPKNRAFLSTYQLLGYMNPSELIVLGPKKKIDSYQIKSKTSVLAIPINQALKPLKEAITYYQGADYLYSHGLMKNE
jgi:phosphoglycerol transferase MdoB-like AlkP superfamily enzyme